VLSRDTDLHLEFRTAPKVTNDRAEFDGFRPSPEDEQDYDSVFTLRQVSVLAQNDCDVVLTWKAHRGPSLEGRRTRGGGHQGRGGIGGWLLVTVGDSTLGQIVW
jgi:hypothetical protein